MKLAKYTLGIGDRFGAEGEAQLRALQQAEALGVEVVPVWNKSNREHSIIGTVPVDTRREADDAVRKCGWRRPYFVDADHISLTTVDRFLDSSDFFTIDVAEYIGTPATAAETAEFMGAMKPFRGSLAIPGIAAPFEVSDALLASVAQKYLHAVVEAGTVYRHIAERKESTGFVAEVSVDEADSPQTPGELFFILAAIARARIPLQTIAPKFTGSFLKGIDYVGDVGKFTTEFEDDLAVIAFAVERFDLPPDLKLSIHSGSDKFSLYPVMHRAINRANAGLHLKTAGTTWLEEVIGLAASGGDGLLLAKEVYARAFERYDELCKPYLSVISIDRAKLPAPAAVERWSAGEYCGALRHDQGCPQFNVHFRQLVHVGYKVAAEFGGRYINLLSACRAAVESNVTMNIFERHIRPLFLGNGPGRSTAQKSSARLRA
jgi:hypothetical protein